MTELVSILMIKLLICCGQSSRRLVVGNEHLQEKSTLTGDDSGGNPPTIKSERRLGNSRKESRSSAKEREGRVSPRVSKGPPQHYCLPRFIVEHGMAPSLMVQTMKSCQIVGGCQSHRGAVKSPWGYQITRVDNALGGIMPLGGSAACCCQN